MLEITDKTSSFKPYNEQKAAILASTPALLKSEGASLETLIENWFYFVYLAKEIIVVNNVGRNIQYDSNAFS